jgi:hypothetical protein
MSEITDEITEELLDSIRTTQACLKDVRELAGKLGHLSVAQTESLLIKYVEEGEELAVSRLLQACALNKVKLDPEKLCQSIGVSEAMADSAQCFTIQEATAIPPLLARSASEELSGDSQAYAAVLAAELSVKFNLDHTAVMKVLRKIDRKPLGAESRMLVASSMAMLQMNSEGLELKRPYTPFWTNIKLQDILPERRPHAVVGGTYTVRRAVPKLGRNEPCHCGSGKKYKKCCLAGDQELLSDASEYAGKTRSEIKSNPGLVDDPAVIYEMRAYELKKLDPSQLGEEQVYAGYRSATSYGLREIAFKMLLECEKRPGKESFDPGHFEDLIRNVLEAGEIELARNIRDHCGDVWSDPHCIQFSFDLLENQQRYELLEQECRKSLASNKDAGMADESLVSLAYHFERCYPAMAVMFARAAIASHPDNVLDNSLLLDLIRGVRSDLDLDLWEDPVEELFDWIEDRARLERKTEFENAEIKRLSEKLEDARTDLNEKRQALSGMVQELSKSEKKLEKAQHLGAQNVQAAQDHDSGNHGKDEALQRLRRHVENQQAEIGEQQKQRADLRKQLAIERRKHAQEAPRKRETDEEAVAEENVVLEPSGRPLAPEYSDTFRKSCDSLPPRIASRAILAAGRFASHEPTIWQQTKPIQRLAERYRIRIHRDYRMIVHWKPGKSLHILDVIPRQDLVSWIKRHG